MTEIVMATALLTGLVLLLSILVMGARAALLPTEEFAITVNDSREVTGKTGEKLLAILLDADIPVPSPCAGQGICGLCRVTIPTGGGALLPTETARLDRKLIGQGVRLACQVVVRGPLEVRVSEDILAAESFESTVVSSRMLAPLIKELVLDVPADVDFSFRAGSFVQLTAPPYRLDYSDIEVAPEHEGMWHRTGWRALAAGTDERVSRAYSIASTPADAGRIVLDIRLAIPPPHADPGVPPGIVSSWLFGLKAGDPVTVAGPFGDFHARDTDREIVVVGGGVGMAPLRAIIFDQLERIGTSRKISFWYGARSAGDLFYRDEFDRLAERHENFTWTAALSDPASGDEWTGATGFIHEVVFRDYLADHPSPDACEYYLCGPPLMIQAVLAMLDSLGVEPESIFNDDFGT